MIDESCRYRIEVNIYRGDELEFRRNVSTDRKPVQVILKYAEDEQEQE